VSEAEEHPIESYDALVHWRCPQLGGEAPFRYCRKVNEGLPCARLFSCWQTVFDVKAFVERHYDAAEIAAAWGRPRPDKMAQLADLIAHARQTTIQPSGAPNPSVEENRLNDGQSH